MQQQVAPGTTTNGHSHTSDHGNEYGRRPTFGQWIKGTWGDILTMVLMGVLGLGLYMSPPAPNRLFPITFQDGEVVYPQFA